MITYPFIPVNEPDLRGNEKKYLIECIDSGWISSEGRFIREFETKFSSSVQRKFGVAVSSGSTALELAVRALNIPADSEVIMPAFTIISCAAAILRANLVPVLVDADIATWNMDCAQIEDRITERTKAIMVVHIYGLPADMAPILNLAAKYGLSIIEDAAEMHGQTYNGRPCGSFGEISVFSFYPNKLITSGEGGMILTDSPQIAEHSQSMRNLCFQPERRFVHNELGHNFRMSNLQAAVGVAQLERLPEFIEKKRRMGALYHHLLSEIEELILPLSKMPFADNIYWVFGMVLSQNVDFDAYEIMARLKKMNIDTRPFFWGMHEQPVFNKLGLFQNEHYSITERISRRGFYIPSGLGITEAQQVLVVEAIKKSLSKKW